MSGWTILSVIFYPVAALWFTGFTSRPDRYSALASGVIVFLILWLYALPSELAWSIGPLTWDSRFVLPVTAYLCGLAVAAILMSWTVRNRT